MQQTSPSRDSEHHQNSNQPRVPQFKKAILPSRTAKLFGRWCPGTPRTVGHSEHIRNAKARSL